MKKLELKKDVITKLEKKQMSEMTGGYSLETKIGKCLQTQQVSCLVKCSGFMSCQ